MDSQGDGLDQDVATPRRAESFTGRVYSREQVEAFHEVWRQDLEQHAGSLQGEAREAASALAEHRVDCEPYAFLGALPASDSDDSGVGSDGEWRSRRSRPAGDFVD
eukprot:6045956-Alexandrium_andersonii.AAC.1